MVNYIVAVYAGKRRGYGEILPINKFLEKHFKFLEKKPNHISGFTFIINKSENDEEYIKTINNFISKSNLTGKVIVRENLHGSYGAWEKGILETHTDYLYSFLIEDDYIPSRVDFLDFFISKIKTNCYVSSFWNNNHASISNGLLDNHIVKSTVNKHGKLFQLQKDKKYGSFLTCQLTFLNLLDCEFTDITDVGHTIYREPSKNKLHYVNVDLPLLIEPII